MEIPCLPRALCEKPKIGNIVLNLVEKVQEQVGQGVVVGRDKWGFVVVVIVLLLYCPALRKYLTYFLFFF